MSNVAKLALAALVAVICVDALAATSALAVESLFLNESGKALLFTADGIGAVTLRGDQAGAEGTITCNEDKVHGFALDKSSLVRELHIEFKGGCEQTLKTGKGKCTEPIKPVLSRGELGLLNGHVLLLVAPETGTEFVKISCTNGETKFAGAVIGEFKLDGRDGRVQYSVFQKNYLLLFKANGVKQEPEEIELLGSLMKGVALKVEGFFGEKASEEAAQLLLFDGQAEIVGEQSFIIEITPRAPGRVPAEPSTLKLTIKNNNATETGAINHEEVTTPFRITTKNCGVFLASLASCENTVTIPAGQSGTRGELRFELEFAHEDVERRYSLIAA